MPQKWAIEPLITRSHGSVATGEMGWFKTKIQSLCRFNNLNTGELRQSDQIRRDSYKHRPAIGYESDMLLSDIFGEEHGTSTAGVGGILLLTGSGIAILACIILSTVIALCSDFTFLPTLGICYCTTASFILILVGLWGLNEMSQNSWDD